MFKVGTYVNISLTQHKEVLISATQKSQFIRTIYIIFDKELTIQI